MKLVSIKLTYDYAVQRVNLTWHDINFAIKNHFLMPKAAIEHAIVELEKKEDTCSSLIELASLGNEDSIHPYIDDLVSREKLPNNIEIDKWLYLLLSWVFDNKNQLKDPLTIVEQLYADFNYPKQISSFVRYMPSNEPDLGNKELNEDKLYNEWKRYLEDREYIFMQK